MNTRQISSHHHRHIQNTSNSSHSLTDDPSPKPDSSHNKKPAGSFPIKKVKKPESSSPPKQEKKQKRSTKKNTINKLPSIPFKKVSKCPKPTLLKAMDNNYYIIFLTDYFSDKQCLSYDIKRETYFELCEYPELKFISPSCSASPDGKHIFIYDGEHQSFAMLDININTNDLFNRPKVSNIKKTTPKYQKLRNLVKTGKGLLSIYLPTPWDEFHIIGGKNNIQHLKWSSSKKQFVEVSETASIVNIGNEKGLLANNIFFSSKLRGFILLGGNDDNDLISTLTYSSRKDKSAGFWWFKSVLRLPYKKMNGFGSIIYIEKHIMIFGGNIKTSKTQKQFKLTAGIFILDIERNKWTKSQICCPHPGTYYAIYVEQTRNIHLFSREFINNELKHWSINIDTILKQQIDVKVDEKVKIDQEVKMDQEIDVNNDNDTDGDDTDSEDIDGDNLSIQKLQSDITKIWDVVNELKNEMEIIKEYQLEIITNTEQNSLKLLDHHIKIINEINKLKTNNNNNSDNDKRIESKKTNNDNKDDDDDDDNDDDDDTKEDIKDINISKDTEEIKSWLIESVGFGQYFDKFILNGFTSFDLIKEINDKNDLKNMGIKTFAHQIKIINEINKLKNNNYSDNNNNDDNQDEDQDEDEINTQNMNNPFYHKEEEQIKTQNITNPFYVHDQDEANNT